MLTGRGAALVPGLVNGHGHAAMTLLRGHGDDLPLMRWLETSIWPAEARLTHEDVYWGTRLACLEMIRAGTTRAWDMYWFQFDVARAFVDSGMRATVSQVFLSFDGAPDDARPEAAPEGLDRLAGLGPLINPSLGPHAIYTVDEPTLRFVADLAGERSVPVQIHLSETESEVHDCVREHGCRPAEYLDRLGLLTERTVLAHGVWLDDAELELVARRGAAIVTNPVSNMKLAVGRTFPYPAARAAGIPIGLGTDGAASNNSLDLLSELKVLTLLQKHTAVDAAVLPAPDAWAIATGCGRADPRWHPPGRRRARRLRARRHGLARAGAGAPRRRPGLLRIRRGGAERRRGRTGPDARSSRRRRGRDPGTGRVRRPEGAHRMIRTGDHAESATTRGSR